MTEPTPIVLSSPDAGNRGAGEILRRAREAQNLTLEGLASTIKVTPAKLDALEQGRFDTLLDANFTRALAMTVCRALKMDPTEVLAALPAARPAALAEGKPPLNQPFKDVRGGSPLFDRSFDWGAVLSLRWGAPLLLLLGAVVIYALPDSAVDVPGWLHKMTQSTPQARTADVAGADAGASGLQGAPSVATGMAPAASMADAASGGASSVPASSLVLDSADPAASVAAPAAVLDPRLTQPGASIPSAATQAVPTMAPPQQAVAPMVAPAAAGNAVTFATGAGAIALAVRESSWIEVRDAKGAKLLSRHVQAGETLALDGVAPFNLRIGNAPGVQLSYKGQAVDLAPMTRNNVARVELK